MKQGPISLSYFDKVHKLTFGFDQTNTDVFSENYIDFLYEELNKKKS